MITRTVSIIAAFTALILSCKNEDNGAIPVEYHITVGDTAITIPDSAVTFAADHFSFHAYMLREYQVATDEDLPHPGATFSGTLVEWKVLGWDARQTFLLPPYNRDARTGDAAQYFYWIGTFIEQFGYGWRDTFDPEADLANPAVHIWQHPADSTLAPDNAGTIEFDGESRFIGQYRAKWRIE